MGAQGIDSLAILCFDPVVGSSSEKVLSLSDRLEQITTMPFTVRHTQRFVGRIWRVGKDPEFEESRVLRPVGRDGTDRHKPEGDAREHFQPSVANGGGKQLA